MYLGEIELKKEISLLHSLRGAIKRKAGFMGIISLIYNLRIYIHTITIDLNMFYFFSSGGPNCLFYFLCQ